MILDNQGADGKSGLAGVMAQPEPASATPEATTDGAKSDAPSGGDLGGKADRPATSQSRNAGKFAKDADPATPTPPAYQPNYKFKVLDKEHEFDDFIKGAIKDAETEKKARELHERAFGLDSVKQDRQTLKSELSQTKEKMATTDRALETLGEYVKTGDYDSFFEALRIPKQDILKYAVALVQREQDPAKAQAHEMQRRADLASRGYERQSAELLQSQQAFAVQQRTFELQNVTSRPEVQAVAQAYNAGMGNPGAFQEYVIAIGASYAARGQDLPAEQAVAEAIKHLRAVNPQLGTSGTPTGPAVVQPHAKPVIPSIQGRGTSPVRSTYKSIEDLNRRRRELEAAGQ